MRWLYTYVMIKQNVRDKFGPQEDLLPVPETNSMALRGKGLGS